MVSFLLKLKRTTWQVFSYEFHKTFQNINSTEQLWGAASYYLFSGSKLVGEGGKAFSTLL